MDDSGGRAQDATDTGERLEAALLELLEPARDAVRRLVAAGQVEVTQRGEVVDLDTARGPIRVRRATN